MPQRNDEDFVFCIVCYLILDTMLIYEKFNNRVEHPWWLVALATAIPLIVAAIWMIYYRKNK